MTDDRELFRHTVAVLAYRAAKPLRDAPETFALVCLRAKRTKERRGQRRQRTAF